MIFKNFEAAIVLLGCFKMFKNALGQFGPNRTPKHVITSTNLILTPLVEKQVRFSFGKNSIDDVMDVSIAIAYVIVVF